jgi:hypothetical protein
MKSTQVSIILVVVMAMLPLLLLAQEASKIDTVKVVDNPARVVITEDGQEVVVNIDGAYKDKDYKYEYRAKPSSKGFVTEQTENHRLRFEHPFSTCDSSYKKTHWEVFTSDLMFGWGGHSVASADRDLLKKSMSEIGILNLVSLARVFNQGRSRVSFGLGFNWHRYNLETPYFWLRSNEGVLGYGELTEKFDKHRATLIVRSMQFPLMFNQSLGKGWNVALGAVMNWNFYADYHNSYRIGKSDYTETTRGLNQRKISFDGIAMLSWGGLGMYFRYAPQSVFKTGFGPEIKNRWAIGLVIRGVGFCGR